MRPVIALVTDFGLSDPYVGAMKGAILRLAPEATLVDVVHELAPYDVLAGALALDAAYRHFPKGTVFVAVVDPGVGSARRAIAIAAAGCLFVGPDNGIFTFVLEAEPSAEVRRLAMPDVPGGPVSPVFHGRDLFGPAAAQLARGLPFEQAGPLVHDPVRLTLPAKRRAGDAWQGSVLRVDRFGNLTTNLLEADLAELAGASLERLEVRLGDHVLPLVRCYADVAVGAACALVGSSGRLELAVREGRADALGGAASDVVVRRRS
jgi:S-adenosylmethionine hydrolase